VLAKVQEKEGSQPIYESGGEPINFGCANRAEALCWDRFIVFRSPQFSHRAGLKMQCQVVIVRIGFF
jgi:hypothetical protein